MSTADLLDIAERIIRIRLAMMLVNERYKSGKFKIPIHLAFGHEAIAVAIDNEMLRDDQLICSHRNIHYNLARESDIAAIMDEYCLRQEGAAQGRLGSMNLSNPKKNVIYSSSILGNNLPVATGLALGNKLESSEAVVIVVTGDGGIEEGAFFESLGFLKYQNLRCIIVVENNGWSLGTRIEERRAQIDIQLLAQSMGVGYKRLAGNDCLKYISEMHSLLSSVRRNSEVIVVEVMVDTLGDWILRTDEHPMGKHVNYHAGPAPTVALEEGPIISNSDADPLHIIREQIGDELVEKISSQVLFRLQKSLHVLH